MGIVAERNNGRAASNAVRHGYVGPTASESDVHDFRLARELSTVAFAHRVAFARGVRALKMGEVGRAGDVSGSTVSRLEAGLKHPRLGTLHRVALGLDTDPAWLITAVEPDGEVPHWPGGLPRDPDRLLQTFAWRLGVARRWLGWSAIELATRAGFPPRSQREVVSRWEANLEQPMLLTVERLAAALDAPVPWLLGVGEVAGPWAR